MRPVQIRNVWRPNIIKHCLVTKHDTDVEMSGQTVKTCLIKHRFNSTSKERWATNYPAHLAQPRDFNIAEFTTSQVPIQKFTLKKSIAAIILLDILKEAGKSGNRRG